VSFFFRFRVSGFFLSKKKLKKKTKTLSFLTDEQRHFWHGRARHRRHHLGPVLGDPFRLVFFPDHKPLDVLQKQQRDPPLLAQLDEVRSLQRRL